MKILLIRNDNIGDIICTTPAIEALRKKFPEAQIDIVVNSLNAVVENNPFLNNVFIYTKPKHKKNISDKISAFLQKCQICFKIWQEKYDVAIIFRSHYSPSAALFARLGARRVIAVDSQKSSQKFITDKVKFDNSHEVLFCFELLKPLGISYDDEKTLFIPKNPDIKFENFIFFHISSRLVENSLSEYKLIEILSSLKIKFQNIVITSENKKFADKISQKTGVLFLQTKNFSELADFLSSAKFLVTLDGGVAHLGPALGINTLVIFGKTNVLRWAPIYAKGRCIFLQDDSKIAEHIQSDLIIDTIEKSII